MAFIREGYVISGTDKLGRAGKTITSRGRSSYLVKRSSSSNSGYVSIGKRGMISFPEEYLGKKIRIKIEEVI